MKIIKAIKELENRIIGTLIARGFKPRNSLEACVTTDAIRLLKPEDFTDGFNREIIRIVSEYYKDEGVFPSSMTIRQTAEQSAELVGYDIQSEIFNRSRNCYQDHRDLATDVSMLKVLSENRSSVGSAEAINKGIIAGIRSKKYSYTGHQQQEKIDDEKF